MPALSNLMTVPMQLGIFETGTTYLCNITTKLRQNVQLTYADWPKLAVHFV